MSMNLDVARIDKDFIQGIINNTEYNKLIIDYYNKLADELNDFYSDTLRNKVNNIAYCNKYWLFDKYEQQKIKDLKKQNLCKDKFCSNCKKVKQAARMSKYIPELEKYQDNLYHLTLTIPNVAGFELKETIKHMSLCFRYLIEYIRCRKKTKDIDFTYWDYKGAVRSLEVTFRGDSYHPHFHVGLILDKNVLSKKVNINTYSYNYGSALPELKNLFSYEEILIQKIWYLLYNKIRVNKKNIDSLDEGYSCKISKFKNTDFVELFKYMTKTSDEDNQLLTYDNFKTLYFALYRVKQIQGYGLLYRIDDNINLEEYKAKYDQLVKELQKKETPIETLEEVKGLLTQNHYTIISRKSYFDYLRSL